MKVFLLNIFMVFFYRKEEKMNYSKTKQLTMASMFLTLGLILPFITMQIPTLGSQLLPMHIPVMICGFVLGPFYGTLIGLMTPILRSIVFGMPPLFPTGICMAFELAAYGFLTGYLYRHMKQTTFNIYVILILSMISGRIVWAVINMMIYGLQGTSFTLSMFIAGALTNALPGIIIQLIFIPIIVVALKKGNWIYERTMDELF